MEKAMMAHACNFGTQETEATGYKFKDSLGLTANTCQKREERREGEGRGEEEWGGQAGTLHRR